MVIHEQDGRIVWPCKLCDERLCVLEQDFAYLSFFVVHHLHGEHALKKEDIVDVEPSLAADVDEYFGVMANG